MEAQKITVQVRMQYEWQETNASRLRKPIEDYLIAALPGANVANGTVLQANIGDFQRQADFSDVRDWLDALGQEAASYRLWISQGANSVNLNIAAGSVDVSIRGEEARVTELRAQVEQFAASAELKPKKLPAPVAPRLATSAFRRVGNYRLLEDSNAEALLKASDLLRSWVGEPLVFTGNLVMKADPGSTQMIRDFNIWRETVSKRWADLATADLFANGPTRSVMLRVQFSDRTVSLNLTAEDAQAGREVLEAFESTIKVAPQVAAGPDAGFREQQRLYYTIAPITADWVRDKMLGMLGRIAAKLSSSRRMSPPVYSVPPPPQSFFGGTFRVADQTYTVQDFDVWANEVQLRWEEMQAAKCWVQTADSRQSLDVDFDREQVTVTLRNRAGATAPAMTFADYESELNLTPAPANPYQYYRFARKYQKSGKWDTGTDRVLADAIAKAVHTAFPEGRYVFVNGSTTAGEAAQEQTPHLNLDDFLQRLRKGEPYVKARIYLQGPRGNDLAVQLQPGENNVELRSSISDGQLFKKVAEPFDKISDLKEYDSEHRNAAGEVQKKPSLGQSLTPWFPALPGIAALLGLFLTALPTQKSTLQILAPKDVADIPGNSCSVTWAVTRNTILHGQTSETPKGRVLVAQEGGDFRSDTPDADSGFTVHFPGDGVYDVTVAVPSAQPQNVRITVKMPSQARAERAQSSRRDSPSRTK